MNENQSNIRFDAGPAKWVRWLLAITGCGLMVATIPVFFPVQLMATIHGWLGLGEFPDGAIAIYLARSTSLMYAVHGFLMLFVALDIQRYWPLVRVFGWLHVVIGLTMFGIDLTTPMPIFWIVGEGIPIAIAGLIIVWLYRKANGSG
jgi:hypothetical protein